MQYKTNKNCNNFSPSQHGTARCALMHRATYITRAGHKNRFYCAPFFLNITPSQTSVVATFVQLVTLEND